MNQLEQGSAGTSLAQSAHIPQDFTAQFLSMARATLANQQEQPARQERPAPMPPPRVAALLTPEGREEAQRQQLSREDAQRFKEQAARAKYLKFTGQQTTPPASNPFCELSEALHEARSSQEAQEAPSQIAPAQFRMESHRKAQKVAQEKVAPQTPPLAELLDLEALKCKRGRGAGGAGAGQLAELLDKLARHLRQARKYSAWVSQVTLHLPQELLAAALDTTPRTVYRWTGQLEAMGYLQAREHFTTATTKSGPRTVVDGMLYAVSLRPGHIARLHHDDLAHQYRDLDADREARRTAYSLLHHFKNKMSESKESLQVGIQQVLLQWVVTPGKINLTPVNLIDSDIFQTPTQTHSAEAAQTVQEVAEMLPLVETAASRHEQAATVATLSAQLAHVLNDTHSRAGWAERIWQAYELGRLQVLAAQLTRAAADFAEYQDIRNPAAWLMARLASQEQPAQLAHAAD